jgi:hypothetical protein
MRKASLRTLSRTVAPFCLHCRVIGGPAACAVKRKSKSLPVPCGSLAPTGSLPLQLILPCMTHHETPGNTPESKFPSSFEDYE